MDKPRPKKSASALSGKLRAQQDAERRIRRILGGGGKRLTDTRVRELYLRSQGGSVSEHEHRAFLRAHQAFVREIFEDLTGNAIPTTEEP